MVLSAANPLNSWIHGLKNKIPKHRPTGQPAVDSQQLLQRQALGKILDSFAENPGLIVATFSQLQSGLIADVNAAASSSSGGDPARWDPAYKSLKKMPKYYMSQVLIARAAMIPSSRKRC